MDTFAALIAAYGLAEFAADIGVSENTAKQMRKRDSVASEYWDAWVKGAAARGFHSLTADRLMKLAAAKRVAQPRDLPAPALQGAA